MIEASPTLAQQIANAANTFQLQMAGHEPKSVSVVLSDDILVVTFHDALAPAEMTLAENPDGAARLKELHRELFANNNGGFRRDIKRITGREVREAAIEIDTATGAVVHVYTTDARVQIFLRSTPVHLRKREARGGEDQLERAEDDGLPMAPQSDDAETTFPAA